MFHNSPKYKHQQGSVLVLAIFVIVVMLLLTGAILRVLSAGEQSLAYEVVGTRAYNAANAGVQRRLASIFPVGGAGSLRCNGTSVATLAEGSENTVTSANPYLNFTGQEGFGSCQVTNVECNNFKQSDVVYYRITSTAQCNMGTEPVVSRTIEVQARTVQ